MTSNRKSINQKLSQKSSTDSENFLQKGFLKRERLLRIYQPKNVTVLCTLSHFLEQNHPIGVDLEVDNSEVLCAALNALADYGK